VLFQAVLAVDLTRQRNQGENDLVAVAVEDSIEQNYQDFERWIALSRLQTKRHD